MTETTHGDPSDPARILDVIRPQMDARHIIVTAFNEFCQVRMEHAERFADAVIARLAGHEPPILLAYPDEMRPADEDVMAAGRRLSMLFEAVAMLTADHAYDPSDLIARIAAERPADDDVVDAVIEPYRVAFHDPLSGHEQTLVVDDDPTATGVEHQCPTGEPKQRLAIADVSPELDSAYCSECGWQARISGAWFMDVIRSVFPDPPDTPFSPMTDLLSLDAWQERAIGYREALVDIAAWFGPGNNEARVKACRALLVDPLVRHDFDYGPAPDFEMPKRPVRDRPQS